MDNHGVTNTDDMCILTLQPQRFQGVQYYQYYIQTTSLFLIGQIIGGGGSTIREYLG